MTDSENQSIAPGASGGLGHRQDDFCSKQFLPKSDFFRGVRSSPIFFRAAAIKANFVQFCSARRARTSPATDENVAQTKAGRMSCNACPRSWP
jgi:hypothetical protein